MKMGNHEDIFSDSKVITSADFRGDTIEISAQKEVRRRCIFLRRNNKQDATL
jgi:hypothetical protein